MMNGLTVLASAGGAASSFSSLQSGITNLMTLAGDMLDTVVANPVLVIPLAGSIVGVAIGVVRRLKRI